MIVYTLLIHDDRYSAPSLYLLTVDDDARASELAHMRLTESSHHHGVELWDGDRLVLKLGSEDNRPPEDGSLLKPISQVDP